MKVLKEEIRSRIVMAACSEFIKNGFKKTSMRTISAKLEIALDSVYNHFKIKDDISYVVLKPLLAVLHERMASYHVEKDKMDKAGFSIQDQKNLLGKALKIISLYREESELLLFESKDTSLEVFCGNFIDEQAAISKGCIDHIQKVYP